MSAAVDVLANMVLMCSTLANSSLYCDVNVGVDVL